MDKLEVISLLQEHGAILNGHFQLASGLHSPVYLQTARVLQYPHVARKLGRALAAKYPQPVDVVLSSTVSSLVLGQEIARLKKCRAIFTEGRTGAPTMRPEFKIETGEKVLIIQDVITTGHLVANILALLRAYGAKTVGVCALVDRSQTGFGLSVPIRSLVSYPLDIAAPQSCAQCSRGIALSPMAGVSAEDA
jgi:orotate phosphoribosyltransferase